MKEYSNICTAEQTKAALELGAPLDIAPESETNVDLVYRHYKHPSPSHDCTSTLYYRPTQEQLVNWLEKKFNVIVGYVPHDNNYAPLFTNIGTNRQNQTSNLGEYSTRQGATSHAINDALLYLQIANGQ